MIKIGKKVRFNPFQGVHTIGFINTSRNVTGEVVYINKDHHWFSVEYLLGGVPMRTSFHFADIRQNVRVLHG
jgi:hypothetical protein